VKNFDRILSIAECGELLIKFLSVLAPIESFFFLQTGDEGTADESPPAGRVTDEMDYFRLANKPSGGELIPGLSAMAIYRQRSVLCCAYSVRESIQ
jgi:hypothetical protein